MAGAVSERKLFLDRGVGEDRGVVTLDGRPERLLLRRAGEALGARLGARLAARVRKVEPAFAAAFLDLGAEGEAMLAFKPDGRPVEGQMLEVEIRTEARDGKLATVRVIGPTEGKPRLLAAAPDLAQQLQEFARDVVIQEGAGARTLADRAEAEVLAVVHPLAGGGSLAIEPTRALTAVDVDLGERKGQDAKRLTRQANLTALAETARLLRLKGLGGLVVIDLVGRGHDGTALLAAARAAFAPDNPGVAIGPVGRFGTLAISIPRRGRAAAEILCDGPGRLSDLTLALRLIRLAQTEAARHPGARLTAQASPAVTRTAEPLAAELGRVIGARLALSAQDGWPRDRLEVHPS